MTTVSFPSTRTPATTAPSGRPISRVVGAAASWFLFASSFHLFLRSMFDVLAVGGSCASGGPYEIAVECPDSTWMTGPAIIAALVAVGVSVGAARGFGLSLVALAWPILFGVLGSVFASAFFLGGDPTGLIIGGMFILMALVPLVMELVASPQRLLIGATNAAGVRFTESGRAKRSLFSTGQPNPLGAVRPTFFSVLASLAFTIGPATLGWFLVPTILGA